MINDSDGIPASLVAGDSANWRRSLTDYPASTGWTLHYALVGASAVYSFDATADGDDFAVALTADTTKTWTPGGYSLQEYVDNVAGERYTITATRLTIAANLAGAIAGLDTRSHAQKVLDSINAWLESKAPVAGAMTINGRSIQYYPIADLLVLRDRYRREVALETAGSVRRGHPVYVSL